MYVTGVGKTKFGVLEYSLPQLAYEAISQAVTDAQLSFAEIKAVYVSNFLGGILQNQLHLNSVISAFFPNHIPIVRLETACASGGAALNQAIMALSKYDPILVLGVEKMTGYDAATTTKAIAAAGDIELDQKQGLSFPAGYALIARTYMERYNVTTEDLALVSFKAHQNANLNPSAHFYTKEVDLNKIRNSTMVSSPLKLFDCSPISDGAAAVIITKERKKYRDIKILASSLRTDTISLVQREEITTFPAAKLAAGDAYKEANVTASDIDLAEVHDCFTIAEMIAMEDLGFCAPGESKHMVRAGETAINGRLPLNPSGGLKANGHPIGATGLSQVYEIVTQLRGEAGKRQVKSAKTGLAHNVGGVGGTAVIHIFGVD